MMTLFQSACRICTMKNPFLSMWLSAANRVAGTARAAVTAEAKKQSTAAVKNATKAAAKPAAPAKKKRVARKRKAKS
jgi:hypothetical protein